MNAKTVVDLASRLGSLSKMPDMTRIWASGPRYVLLALCLVASAFTIRSQDGLVPDATTRATTWNSFAGDFASLSDGLVPPSSDAQAFNWQTKGILVFEWPEVVSLERIRIYVGEIGNNYQVRAYVGGRLDETGTLREPEGLRTALLEIDDRVVNQWIEVPFAEGTRADNLELWTLGPTNFFEVEIYARSPGDSVVRPATWGHVKSGH